MALLRFYVVGAGGIVVQLTALAILKSGFGMSYLPATALAVELAILHNFFWHERWTWVDRTRAMATGRGGRLLRFHLAAGALSIVGNLAVMQTLAGWFHIPYLPANMTAIAVCSLLNYLAADRLVFMPARQP